MDATQDHLLTRSQIRVLLGIALILITAFTPGHLAFVVAVPGLSLAGWALWRPDSDPEPRARAIVIIVLVTTMALGVVSGIVYVPDTGTAGSLLRLLPIIPGVLWFALRYGRSRDALGLAAWTTVLLVAVGGVQLMAVEGGSDRGIDVYLAHRAASSVLLDGGNPYAEVVVPDTNPHAEEGSLVRGYVYPPVALAGYVAGDRIGGDPRWTSAAAWLGSLAILAWAAQRRRSPIALAAVSLLAVAPTWPYTLFAAWTEPLTLLLLTGAIALGTRRPGWSAIGLGLALASKQYMILLAPVLAFAPIPSKRRLVSIALGTAALVTVPGFLPDPASAWRAMITAPLSLQFRPDTQSLPALLNAYDLGQELPRMIWLTLVVGVAAAVSRRVPREANTWAVPSALTLGAGFAFGLAFPNYWLLVAGLLAVSLTLGSESIGAEPALAKAEP